MKSSTRTIMTMFFLMVLLFGLYFFTDWFSKTTGYVLGEDEKIKLAQCLTGKNSVLYTSSTCPDCEKQIENFGEEASKLLEINVCSNLEECPDVAAFPAWKINGEFYYGFQDFDTLIEISKCEI